MPTTFNLCYYSCSSIECAARTGETEVYKGQSLPNLLYLPCYVKMNWVVHEILMSEFERADRQLNVGFRRRIVEIVIIPFHLATGITCRHLWFFRIQSQISVLNVKEGTERKSYIRLPVSLVYSVDTTT